MSILSGKSGSGRPQRFPAAAAWSIALAVALPALLPPSVLAAAPPVFPAAAWAAAAGTPAAATATPGTKGFPHTPTPDGSASWTRFAVIVSASEGLEGDAPLRYAAEDGNKLQRLLSALGEMDPEQVHWIQATSAAQVRKRLAAIGKRIQSARLAGQKVFLQFYYTGHGAARAFHIGGETLSFAEAKALLGGEEPEARVYVLDVCFGASFFAAKGFATTPPVRLQIDLDQATRGEVIISSSAGDEQAYEVRNLGGSVFTSHWAMALRGAGDRNRDGQVTLFEAYNYAYDRTVAYSRETLNLPQHPSFSMDLTGAKDLLLTRPLQMRSGLLFRGCRPGSYQVLDLSRSLPVGEIRLPEEGDFTLAVDPGRYRVDRPSSEGPLLSAEVRVAGETLAPLADGDFQAGTVLAATGKGPFPSPGEGKGSGGSPTERSARAFASDSLRPGPWRFTVDLGAAWTRHGSLSRTLNRPNAYQAASGGLPVLDPASQGMHLQLSWNKPISHSFSWGGFAGVDWVAQTARADGPEPLLPAPASDGLGVTRSLRVALFPWSLGPLLRWDGVFGRHRLTAQSEAGLLYQNLTTRLTESRDLFVQGSSFDCIFTGWGARLGASLGYEWRPAWQASGSGFGIRLHAFRQDMGSLVSEEDGYTLPGLRPFWGLGLSGTFGLQTGRGDRP